MSSTFELLANNRNLIGKLACKKLRLKENQVPAVIYGGKEPNTLISLNHDHVLKASEHENFYSQILHLVINEQKHKVVLKDLQRHPFKPKIVHLDFQRVKETDLITIKVPLHFTGLDKCPGVKLGGLVNYHANTLEIRCQAKSIPEFIEIDLSNIELGQIIHLSDLNLPESVEIPGVNQGKLNAPVVSVQSVKASKESDPATAAAEAASATSENKDPKEKTASKQASSSGGKSDKK